MYGRTVALIKQAFNLKGKKQKLSKLESRAETGMFTLEEAEKLEAKIKKAKKGVKSGEDKLAKGFVQEGIAIASFSYNMAVATTRFGLRGQDIQDQLKLQDKIVNKAFGVIGATAVGGVPAGLIALGGSIVSEVISVFVQNKAYDYNKMIDTEQKQIMQERIGRAVYNSSRRT